MKANLLIVSLGIILALSACTKSEKDPLPQEVQLLTATPWHIESVWEYPLSANFNDTTLGVRVDCNDHKGTLILLADGTVSSNLPEGNCLVGNHYGGYTWEYNEEEYFLSFKAPSASFGVGVANLTKTSATLYGKAGRRADSTIVRYFYYLEAL